MNLLGKAMKKMKQSMLRLKAGRLIQKAWSNVKAYGYGPTLRNIFRFYVRKYKYKWFFRKPLYSQKELDAQREYLFPQERTFSIVVPLYNTPPDFLKEMIQSVLDQTYGKWELCLADGSDEAHQNVKEICLTYAQNDPRIKYKKLKVNLGISGNTNACLDMATGDYIGLFDHDDLLHPSALFEVMHSICETGADFVYTDELTFSGKVSNVISVHFKPDFAPDNLRANNYICHFSVFSKSLLDKAGPFSTAYDGSQDHEFILRATEQAEKIVHIPKLLYFWRCHPNSVAEDLNAKTYAIDAGRRAVRDCLRDIGLTATVESSKINPVIYRISYALQRTPLVSIVILNRDNFQNISRCVASILSKTTYNNYEIVMLDYGSTDENVLNYYKMLTQANGHITLRTWNHPFNHSAMINYAAQFASGEQILLLDCDTEIIAANWIEEMLMYAQREDVGAVGAKLYHHDGTIQSAGILLGQDAPGIGVRAFYGAGKENAGYMGRLYYAQNYSAVSAACMMIPRHVWESVGELDDSFSVNFNDLDLCMRIRQAGYLIVWTPYAELYHFEPKGKNRGNSVRERNAVIEEEKRFVQRWEKELTAGDPYYNPNLTLDRGDFSLK